MMERRKEPRFLIRDNAFAVDAYKPQRLGKIIDISRSGISFQYMEGADNFQPSTELHIFSSIHSIFLRDVPFEATSDLRISGHPASIIFMRRHGGRFPSLSDQQQAQLDKFIDIHSVGVAGTHI